MGRTIEVVDQSPEWSAFFEKEAAHFAVIFGTQLVAIHHIGSTAIPVIKAKPIIDILVVIKHIKTIEMFDAPMQQLGYRPRGECLDNSIPGTPWPLLFQQRHRRRAFASGTCVSRGTRGYPRQTGFSGLSEIASRGSAGIRHDERTIGGETSR